MFNKISKVFVFVFVLSFSFTAVSFSQEKMDSSMNHKSMKMMNHDSTDSMKMDHKHMKGMHMKNDSTSPMKADTTKDSIVRKGVIDLKAIDKNKDGKVYQDVMDYNVISDKPGKCPLCGMTLKEVSIKQAEETLIKAGFKVKK